MLEVADHKPSDEPRFPPTDESGDVDLCMVDYNLSLTPAQRWEQHYGARIFVERLRRIAGERDGSIIDAAQAAK